MEARRRARAFTRRASSRYFVDEVFVVDVVAVPAVPLLPLLPLLPVDPELPLLPAVPLFPVPGGFGNQVGFGHPLASLICFGLGTAVTGPPLLPVGAPLFPVNGPLLPVGAPLFLGTGPMSMVTPPPGLRVTVQPPRDRPAMATLGRALTSPIRHP